MAGPAEVFGELVRLETELWNAVDARLRAEHHLPLARLEPMQVIDRTPRCRVQDVADALVITVGGASKLVDRIAADGSCRRLPHPTDQRSSLLELTDAGRGLLAAASATLDAELRRHLGVIDGPDLDHLADLLRRLRAPHRKDTDHERDHAGRRARRPRTSRGADDP